MTPEAEARIADLKAKRAASTIYPGNLPAPAYKERVVAIDKEIARLEALDGDWRIWLWQSGLKDFPAPLGNG